MRGRAGRTSLHWAVQEGSIDAVRILLEKGADISIEETNTYLTAMDIAEVKALEFSESQKASWSESGENNYERIVNMLMDQTIQSQ